MNKNQRWAVIFNLYGVSTIGEKIVSGAWLPPPPNYSAAEHDPVVDPKKAVKEGEVQPGGMRRTAGERVAGMLRLANGRVAAANPAERILLRGDVSLEPANLTMPPGTRVYVREGWEGFLYPAELGSYAEYVGRWHANARAFGAKRPRKVLWSVPSAAALSAA